jgi:predicted nucleic-acid-binding protein
MRSSPNARALILLASPLFVTEIVLCETLWVLRSMKVPRARLVEIAEGLVEGVEFAYAERARLRRAVAAYRAGSADFSDYVIREHALERDGRLFTFDTALQREPGVQAPPHLRR